MLQEISLSPLEESGKECRVFDWFCISILMRDAIAEVTALRLLSRQAGPGAAARGEGEGSGTCKRPRRLECGRRGVTNRFYEAKRADSSRV